MKQTVKTIHKHRNTWAPAARARIATLLAMAVIVSGCAGAGSMTLAAMRNDVDRIDALVAKGFDVNKPEPGGLRPIEYAVGGGNVEATTRLLEHGADINISNNEGRTPLFHIARNGRPGHMVDLLLDNGADPEVADFFGITPLMIASARGHSNIVRMLMARGASVEHRDSLGRNARDLAIKNWHDGTTGEILASDAVFFCR